MKYILSSHNEHQEPVVYWENGFNSQELDWLQSIARESKKTAEVGLTNGAVVPSKRRSQVSWLSVTNETRWVYEKLSHIVSTINAQYFRYDLSGFGEDIQMTNYNSNEHGMYGWHVDYGRETSEPCRKLSIVLQLSDPSEYEGGNIQFKVFSDEVITARKQRGLILAFPSWTIHQVTPVTSGNRQSLVSWITGPAFK